jgi:hypothetical protein
MQTSAINPDRPGHFGTPFLAPPRNADGLLITGPVSASMRLALAKTYAAAPAPKIVIAVGACAIAGGPFVGHPQVANGADAKVPGTCTSRVARRTRRSFSMAFCACWDGSGRCASIVVPDAGILDL